MSGFAEQQHQRASDGRFSEKPRGTVAPAAAAVLRNQAGLQASSDEIPVMQRPSVKLFLRDPGTGWESVHADNDEPYGWGYEMAKRDMDAGLGPADLTGVCHPDYIEGYNDAYADTR